MADSVQPVASGSLTAFLATKGMASRVFRSVGSKRVRLHWDVAAQTVKIVTVPEETRPAETIVDVPVTRVAKAFVINGNYTLTIDGVVYDMEIQHYEGQKAVMLDLMGVDVGGLPASYADERGDGRQFIAFLKQSLPSGSVIVSSLSARTRIRIVIGAAAVIIVIMMIVGFTSAAQN